MASSPVQHPDSAKFLLLLVKSATFLLLQPQYALADIGDSVRPAHGLLVLLFRWRHRARFRHIGEKVTRPLPGDPHLPFGEARLCSDLAEPSVGEAVGAAHRVETRTDGGGAKVEGCKK